MVEPYAEALG